MLRQIKLSTYEKLMLKSIEYAKLAKIYYNSSEKYSTKIEQLYAQLSDTYLRMASSLYDKS